MRQAYILLIGKILRRICLPVLLILFPLTGKAQYYETGQDPASIHWKQIKTPHFQVIFPSGFTGEAQRMTNLLEYGYTMGSYSLDWHPATIPVILHNYTTESNGLVAWAPKRMELFTTPPQDIYPQDWLEQLALHEFRHVVQVDKLNQGITKAFSYLLGQQLPGALSSALGSWFLEGDATVNETTLSHSGRGRLPSFEMELRAQALDGKRFFNYDESVLQSFRKYVPDYYQFGYQMIAYSRNRYGNRLWSNTLTYVARNPYLINPVHFSLKKETGLNKRQLFDETFDTLRVRWENQDRMESFSPFHILNHRKNNTYVSYRYPQVVNDSEVIALKSGIDQIDAFVLIDRDGKERTLWQPGHSNSQKIHAAGNLVVWDEIIPDARWANRDYSVIKILDWKKHEARVLTRHTRYFSPCLSPDLTKVAAVEVSLENQYSVVVLDALSGKILKEFATPGNAFIQYPSWSPDGNQIIAVSLSAQGKAIVRLDLDDACWRILLSPSFEDISHTTSYGEFILFQGSFSGIENIYSLDPVSGSVFRVTSSRFGAFDPAIDQQNHRLIYADYSALGFDLAEAKLDPGQWLPLEEVKNRSGGFSDELLHQEEGILESKDVPMIEYPVMPYHKATHLFNFHSWMPFYFDLDAFDFSSPDMAPGVTFFSQDKLSTTFTSIGYAYRGGEHYLSTRFLYKGLLPVIDLGYQFGGAPTVIKPSSVLVPSSVTWKDMSFNANLSLPLNFTHSRFIRATIPMVDFTFHNYTYYDLTDKHFYKDIMVTRLRWYDYSLERTSIRDLSPRWGRVFDLSCTFVPFEEGSFNPSFTGRMVLLTPGLFRHHSLRLEGGLQRQDLARYAFTNALPFPRGVTPETTEKLDILSADYVFPLAYPDLRVSSLLYIKRLQAGIFADYARNRYRTSIDSDYEVHLMSSFGGSMTVDYHLFRLPYLINTGVRAAYVPETGIMKYEVLFNIDIYGFNINRR
jgi:hypothetical protein